MPVDAAVSLFPVAMAIAQVQDPALLSSEQSRMCHPEGYDVSVATAHPNSVGAVKVGGHGSDSCLRCVSTDRRRNVTITSV